MTARAEVLVLSAGFVVAMAALLILPNEGDYAELRFRDGDVVRAHDDVVRLRQQAPEDADTAFQLARKQLFLGDVEGAAITLESLIERGTEAPVVRYRLADIYRSMGRQSERLDLLMTVPLADLDADTRTEIAGWLRYLGRHAEERAFLERLSRDGYASPDQRVRLSLLHLSAGETDLAMNGLRQVDDTHGLTGAQPRLTMLDLMLAAGARDEAGDRVKNWHSLDDDPNLRANAERAFEAYGFELGIE